jgi:hypothetical protein
LSLSSSLSLLVSFLATWVISGSKSLLLDNIIRESSILEGPPISISLISFILLGKLRALILLYVFTILISLLEKGLRLGLRFRVGVRVELIKVIKVYYRLAIIFIVYSYISFRCLFSSASL